MHDHPVSAALEPLERAPRAPARWKRLAMLTAAALLLHVATVGGLQWTWAGPDRLPMEAVQLRVIDEVAQVAQVEPIATANEPMPATPKAPSATPAAPKRTAAAPLHPIEPAQPVSVEPVEAPIVLALAATADIAVPVASAPVVVDEPIPRYRTKPPPPMLLRYDLRRGGLSGSGELTWRPQGDHYELTLEGKVGSLAVLTQTSTGGFDAAGIAPVRFTDKRLTRSATAVNFQRAAGKITFSGPSTEYPLREGTQDRVSWMIQLASIISADPRLRAVGAKVAMMVVGSHGEAAPWVFRSSGPEVVQAASGPVDTVKFVREPRDPNDATVQVWLDPQRNDLPVRAIQQSGARDEPFELRVLSIVPAP